MEMSPKPICPEDPIQGRSGAVHQDMIHLKDERFAVANPSGIQKIALTIPMLPQMMSRQNMLSIQLVTRRRLQTNKSLWRSGQMGQTKAICFSIQAYTRPVKMGRPGLIVQMNRALKTSV